MCMCIRICICVFVGVHVSRGRHFPFLSILSFDGFLTDLNLFEFQDFLTLFIYCFKNLLNFPNRDRNSFHVVNSHKKNKMILLVRLN